MFRNLRRINQQMSAEEISAVMIRCSSGVLACSGDQGYPYAVPLNYVYFDHRIYFHSAKEGHKIDAILNNPKVSFAVIDKDQIVAEEVTSYFASTIAFGRARLAEGDERLDAMRALITKYSGDIFTEERLQELISCQKALIVAIDIDHLTGKQAKEMRKQSS